MGKSALFDLFHMQLTFRTVKTFKTFLTYKHYDLQQRGTGNVPSS